jgi:hypothetical protein
MSLQPLSLSWPRGKGVLEVGEGLCKPRDLALALQKFSGRSRLPPLNTKKINSPKQPPATGFTSPSRMHPAGQGE